jgi:hypothetical protein
MITLRGWKATLYGFLELDAIRDSTQSFGDSVGNTPLLRTDGSTPAELPNTAQPYNYTFSSKNPRVMFTPRNTTFGLKLEPPEIVSTKVTGVLEFDFFGNQPGNPLSQTTATSTTESSYFSSASPRMRHAYVDVKSPIIDVMAGQAYNLFGWQPLFFPPTDSFLGIPNMIFDRRAQLRLTKRIETPAINVTLAGAALRPAQADGGFPDLVGAILFQANGWKGAHMLGPSEPKYDPLSFGVSTVYRQFAVSEFIDNAGAPRVSSQDAKASGRGFSFDALIPVIPVRDPKDRSNGLTITASYVVGEGIGDLYTGGLTGGIVFPNPHGQQGDFQGTYASNIDPGVVQYAIVTQGNPPQPIHDVDGNFVGILRTIDWETYTVGLQYYLPFLEGRAVITGNYSHAYSDNVQQQPTNVYANEKAAGGDPTRTFKAANYYDANLFVGLTDSFKVALSWQHVEQIFLASGAATLGQPVVMRDSPEHNDRFEISTFFFF